VNFAVNNNTNVVLAKERLAQAKEGVTQINAQGLPQLGSNIADTYSSFSESTTTFGPTVTNPVLPTGTTIPTVVDEAADFSSSYGIGSASSGGSSFGAAYGAPLDTTGSSLPATSPASPSGTTSTSSSPAATQGTTTAPTTETAPASGNSDGTQSPTSMSAPDAPPSASGASFNLMPMPLIIQNYVTEPSTPAVVADNASSGLETTADAQKAPAAKSADDSQPSAIVAPPEHADQSSTVSSSTVTGSRTVNNYGARVNLSQYIDAFGLLSAAKDAEKLTRDFYALDVDRTENEVALAAKNLFFNVILAQQQVATEQEQVKDATESVRVTNALVQQGQAAGFDLLSAETTLANNQQLLTTAKNQLSFAQADLDYLLGVNPNTAVNLIAPTLPSLTESIDLGQSTAVALQRRPEIIEANKNIAIAQKLVKVASEGTTPTIGLVGTYGYNSTSTVTGPTNEGLVSAQIAVPFYDGGATRSKVREAKEVLQTQVTTRDEFKLSVALEVRQAYLNVLDGQTQASTAQAGVDLAVETLRVANVQYQNGVGTILDVENAEAQLATARTNLANAQYTYQTSLAALVRDIGSR